jgi:hypothetical protein
MEKDVTMQPRKKSSDNFKSIKGIGPARERWLQETFNVHTYKELADLTTSQIENKIKEEGKIVSRKHISSWIEQAKELISENQTNNQVEEAGVTKELVEKLGSSGFQNGWRPFASFLVYFQTRGKKQSPTDTQTLVHYMEQDREAYWAGIQSKELIGWMLNQISEIVELPVEEEEDKKLLVSQQNTKSSAKIKINQVCIYQPISADLPVYKINAGDTLEGNLIRNRPFRVVVDYDIIGDSTRQLSEEGIKCVARCYEYDKSSKTSELIAESSWQKLVAGKLKYSCEIPETTLSKGNYNFWIIVTTLQTNLLSPDFVEINTFTVA